MKDDGPLVERLMVFLLCAASCNTAGPVRTTTANRGGELRGRFSCRASGAFSRRVTARVSTYASRMRSRVRYDAHVTTLVPPEQPADDFDALRARVAELEAVLDQRAADAD